MQIRMRNMAQQAVMASAPLPQRYWQLLRWWVGLGVIAFLALVIVFFLMVVKPV